MVKYPTKTRALVAFVTLLTLFLFLADFLVIYHQRNHSLQEYTQHSLHEVSLLGDLISESLLRNDYANIERFINDWGKNYKALIQISIITDNNFELARYTRSDLPGKHTLPIEQVFTYANDKSFTVKLLKDSSTIHDEISSLSNRLILSSILFVLVLGIFMWKTLEIMAIQPLQKEINERIKVEKELKTARDQALQASRHKSEFMANMSHELRTPLNSIIGFTSIVKEGLAGPVNEEQKKQLELVFTSSEHLLGLINSILDLAKVEAGKYEAIKTSFNLDLLLEELSSVLKPLADEKSLAFIIMSGCKTGEIYTDRNMLSQILINLLSNAIKFTEQGTITLDCQQQADNLVVRVTDTGIGISPDSLEEIFDAFKQVDSGTTRRYQGTGLGLSISQHFARMLNGRLDVESQPGKGSTFTVTLPITG